MPRCHLQVSLVTSGHTSTPHARGWSRPLRVVEHRTSAAPVVRGATWTSSRTRFPGPTASTSRRAGAASGQPRRERGSWSPRWPSWAAGRLGRFADGGRHACDRRGPEVHRRRTGPYGRQCIPPGPGPVTIVIGWGRASRKLILTWDRRRSVSERAGAVQVEQAYCCCTTWVAGGCCGRAGRCLVPLLVMA